MFVSRNDMYEPEHTKSSDPINFLELYIKYKVGSIIYPKIPLLLYLLYDHSWQGMEITKSEYAKGIAIMIKAEKEKKAVYISLE